jgi:adenylylsulfate kinase-like enzyme
MTASFHWKHTPLIWITGMPGSGKSTLAAQLTDHLRNNGQECIHLDGDNLRQILDRENHASDYSLPSRLELAYLYSKLALYLNAQRITIIVSTVSLFWEVQKMNRANADLYFEVLLEVEEELLIRGPRSVLYESGVQNEIVPEFPLHPELILRASKSTDRDSWFEKLIDKLGSFCE